MADEIATPSTSVPALEPASSIRAPPPLSPREMRAWTRETLGSASTTVLPGARPIVMSPTRGTRVWSASTSSSGAAAPATGAPQVPQYSAPCESCRRQLVQSTGYPSDSGWKTGLSPAKPSVCCLDGWPTGIRASWPLGSSQISSAWTTTSSRPSERHATLHARTFCALASVSRKSLGLPR